MISLNGEIWLFNIFLHATEAKFSILLDWRLLSLMSLNKQLIGFLLLSKEIIMIGCFVAFELIKLCINFIIVALVHLIHLIFVLNS